MLTVKTEAARGRTRGFPAVGRRSGWGTNFFGSGALARILSKAASLSMPPSLSHATSLHRDLPADNVVTT